jgi:hypothetical protein
MAMNGKLSKEDVYPTSTGKAGLHRLLIAILWHSMNIDRMTPAEALHDLEWAGATEEEIISLMGGE